MPFAPIAEGQPPAGQAPTISQVTGFVQQWGDRANITDISEITPLLIITKLEQYDYAGATAIAAVMLVISFALLFLINLLQWWAGRRLARA